MTTHDASPLDRLCAIHGIDRSYHDVHGNLRVGSEEATLGVLRSLTGRDVSPDGAADFATESEMALWRSPLEPVVALWEGSPAAIPLRLPANLADLTVDAGIELENGETIEWRWNLAEFPAAESREIAGERFVVKRPTLPTRPPLGWHVLRVRFAEACATLIVAPERCASPRGESLWGGFLPLYALARNDRPGTYSDLAELGRRLADMGGGVVATLPFLAAFLDEPFEPSPYSPVSRLFWNELYVDAERTPEFERCPEARALMENAEYRAERKRLAEAPWADYRARAAHARKPLELLSRDFITKVGERRREEFYKFGEVVPDVLDYASFRAVGERQRRWWGEWPERLRDGKLQPEDRDSEAYDYHAYAQWIAHEQIAELGRAASAKGPGLYLDLPLGVNSAGYDVWRERDAFAMGVSAGAPPDAFFTLGQSWGFPPLHPQGLRRQGYRYLRRYLQRHLSHAGMLRIDHVMGLHRLYWIPPGFKPTEGLYVRYNAEEMYAIVALESRRCDAAVVGEDLGTVPPATREAMERHGLLRMFVFPFELRPERGPERLLDAPPVDSVASMNTHDMPTFRSYWEGSDIDDRRDLGLISDDEARGEREGRAHARRTIAEMFRLRGETADLAPDDPGNAESRRAALAACQEWLAASSARIVLANLEDLLDEPLPQNTPGTSHERPNWRRRAAKTLEELGEDAAARGIMDRMDRARRARG